MMGWARPVNMVLVRTKDEPVLVRPHSAIIKQWDLGRLFKPTRFVIQPDWTSYVVADLRVGKDSQVESKRPINGKKFQPDRPPGFKPSGGEFDMALPGVLLTASVSNVTKFAWTLRCHWIGLMEDDDGSGTVVSDRVEVI